jgi:hypothetical protein
LFDLLDLAGALVGATLCEDGDGEGGLAQPDALGEKADGVLFEE